jgi:hypothetical protein
MFVPLPQRYKVPLLIGLTIAIGIVVFSSNINIYKAVLAVLGAIVGAVFLDIEYILQAYMIDPYNEHSVRIKEYISSKKFLGLIRYFDEAEYRFGEMSIRSAAFQILLALFGFYFIAAAKGSNLFALCLSISLFANLLYFQILELVSTKTLSRWFWLFDIEMSFGAYKVYVAIMFGMLVLQLCNL